MPPSPFSSPDLWRRHYIRKAGARNYWFDFAESKVNRFNQKFGENFCLVILRQNDDAFVIPWSVAKKTFVDSALDLRHRWYGTVERDVLTLGLSQRKLPVAKYHNALDLLG